MCTGERCSAGHKVGKRKAAPQIELDVLQARLDAACRTAQKKGLFHLSWLPVGRCLGRACPVAASLQLQTTGRPLRRFVFSLVRDAETRLRMRLIHVGPGMPLKLAQRCRPFPTRSMFLSRWPRATYPTSKGSPCMAFAPVLAGTVFEAWDHGNAPAALKRHSCFVCRGWL